MMAIIENLREPAESSYKKKHGRSGVGQTSFRKRLIKVYRIRLPSSKHTRFGVLMAMKRMMAMVERMMVTMKD